MTIEITAATMIVSSDCDDNNYDDQNDSIVAAVVMW
jgi:hypothetical protein